MSKTIHHNSVAIAKAIGIILMVIGHSGCPQFMFKIIYLFHMPLFFFCSGIFYKEITNYEVLKNFVKKKIKGLYLPFVEWSTVFLLLHNFFMYVGIYNPFYGYEGGSSFYSVPVVLKKLLLILFTMHGYEELLGGFWFIRALFISTLLIAIISVFFKKRLFYKYGIMCLFFLVMTIFIRRYLPNNDFWHVISLGTFGAVFYMLGFILKQFDYWWNNIYSATICCIILMFSSLYFKEGVSMDCGFNKVFMFSFSAISGSLFVLYISRLIERYSTLVKSILFYIGNHTLVILAMHFLSFRLVSYGISMLYGVDLVHVAEHPVMMLPQIMNSMWWVVYSVIGLLLPLLFISVEHKIVKTFKRDILCR